MSTGDPRHEAATDVLFDLLAEKIATAMAEKLAPLIAEGPGGAVELPEQVMHTCEAAEFLGVSHGRFRSIAPSLPRAKISAQRYVYLRSELVAWLKNGGLEAGSNSDHDPGVAQCSRGRKRGPRKRVERLV